MHSRLGARREIRRRTRTDERAGLGRANRLACAGLGEHDVPEIVIRLGESQTDKSPFVLFADGGDEALDGIVGHFVEDADGLAWQKRRVHDNKGAVGADKLRGGLEIDQLAFRHLAANAKRNLQRDANRTPALWVSCAMHSPGLEGDSKGKCPTFWRQSQEAKRRGGTSI